VGTSRDKLKKIMSLILSVFVLAVISVEAKAELKTVPFVDVNRYLGDWYQISHIPLFFEGGTCACARQRLTLGSKGVVNVYNSCNDQNAKGKLRDIQGEAYNDDPITNAKFTVDFHLAQKGTYWIIGLDPEYRFAVVSDKFQYSLYILSKTPTLSAKLYQEALRVAASQLDTSKLETTDQNGCQYPQ
jgi:apolipoprotein D and lipocalin family protein